MAATYDVQLLEQRRAADIVFSPDESRIYVAMRNGEIHVFDSATRQPLAIWDVGNALGGLSVSADGSFLLVTERDGAAGHSILYKVATATGHVDTFQVAGGALRDVEIVDSDTAIVSGDSM
ncbi:MAG: hypothetical protein E6G94_16720, partial [Alphaproteobacteria bacterium]